MAGHPNFELANATIVIVGVGLLGGSLGLALRGCCARRVGVVAPGDDAGAQAVFAAGAVDEVLGLEEGAAAADLVVLATPVAEIVRLVPVVAGAMRADAVLTDLGSTKAEVVAAMAVAGVSAAGGHPMCGGVDAGIEHARADLFTHAAWAICGRDRRAVAVVQALAEAVGSRPMEFEAEAHDRAVAMVSHLPYAIAQALVHLVTKHGMPGGGPLAATGFAGATRMASGDPQMWTDILLTNQTAVSDALGDLGAHLAGLRDLVQAGDENDLRTWLEAGARH